MQDIDVIKSINSA